MKFALKNALEKGLAIVLPVFEESKLFRHDLIKPLSIEDRTYVAHLEKSLPLSKANHAALLPSGRRLLLLGMGKKKEYSWKKALLLIRQVVVFAKKERITKVAVFLTDFLPLKKDVSLTDLGEAFSTQALLADFEFDRYKEAPKEGKATIETVHLIISGANPRLEAAITKGVVIGEEINRARELSNTPGGDMTPKKLAMAAEKAGARTGFKVKVLDQKAMTELGMGGVLGVAKGSDEEPRFIVAEYLKGSKKDKPVVLVGKGVTFDTGGLNLKPSSAIYEMHMDMSGGAAVIHTVAILARLKIKKNVVALIPAVENMPSGSSYRPGDLLKSMSGKTIEVLNTDAEGRVILADALTYAQKFYQPKLVVDVATLTGAAMVALGTRASALFTTEPKLEKTLREVGEHTGDRVWPLPLWEEYEGDVKGTFGDVANANKDRYGGAINGAVFLWQFIKGVPWVHLDIAPRMTAADDEFLGKGAAGASIALLTRFLQKF